jgi:tetratricopeptide (TPR) repeat protein
MAAGKLLYHASMHTRPPATAVKLLITALLFSAAAAQTPENFKDTLARGAIAFKSGQFADAATAFEQAHDLDPNSTIAIVDLACAYAYQVVPNLDTPENLALADKAIALFRLIPAEDSSYYIALKQIGSLYRNTKRFDQAREAELASLNLQPDDPDTHYTIGVIDWTQAYKFATMTLNMSGLTDNGIGNAKMTSATCEKIRTHNAPLIEDAITHLTRAVDLKPTYADAMEYLNLAYRRKADFDCANPAARAQEIATAEDWVRKATAAHKANDASAKAPTPGKAGSTTLP